MGRLGLRPSRVLPWVGQIISGWQNAGRLQEQWRTMRQKVLFPFLEGGCGISRGQCMSAVVHGGFMGFHDAQ